MRLVRNGRQPGTQLVELSVDKNSAWVAVTGSECVELKNLHCVKSVARKRLVETAID
jgi:hypothetical protein